MHAQCTAAQQLCPNDIQIPLRKSGGQLKLPNEVESLMVDTALYFVYVCIPLIKADMLEIVVHITDKIAV